MVFFSKLEPNHACFSVFTFIIAGGNVKMLTLHGLQVTTVHI